MRKSFLFSAALLLCFNAYAIAQTPTLEQAGSAIKSMFESNPGAAWVAYAKAQLSTDAAMQSQRIEKLALSTLRGDMGAADRLGASQQQLTRDLELLTNGGQYRGRTIPGVSPSEQAMLANAKLAWKNSARATTTILEQTSTLTRYYATVEKMKVMTPQLLEVSEQISTLYMVNSGTPREISSASFLPMLCIRLDRSTETFFATDSINPETAFLLGKDTNTFRDITDGLMNGSASLHLSATKNKDIHAKLTDLRASFEGYQQSVKSILDDLKIFIALKQSALYITTENESLKNRFLELQEAYQKSVDASV
ncbi:MAG TPA: hypothetical protein VNW52_04825 [Burkholderiaceae bacterium]|jgi:twitching motility protein PilJ|nr:hypothetical protein [Burkholderiaceae bacterium]